MNQMDFQVEEEEASRLREILFPKKPNKGSRSSFDTSLSMGKQNTFLNQTYCIRNQIDKLKRGMLIFMQRQADTILGSECLISTPRECLELIKEMSENMVNYNDEINEAVNTLLESIPKMPVRTVSNNKYFLNMLKINCLITTIYYAKRRVYGQAFDQIRKINSQQILAEQNQAKQNKKMRRNVKRYEQIKLSSALNMWRRNTLTDKKIETQKYQQENGIDKIYKSLSYLSQQGKMILWLQDQLSPQADSVELLILDHKINTLRGYTYSTDNLASVFETLQNQSQEQQEPEKRKIKRIQFLLQHSLTKICICKRQTIKIEDIKSDIDYRKIDDRISSHGLTARQTMNCGIFTPLINENEQCIGVIRQYFSHRLGNHLQQTKIHRISEWLQNGIRVSKLFDDSKQRSQTIRQQIYLKSMKIINMLKNPQNNLQDIQTGFNTLMNKYFNFVKIDDYQYLMAREKNNIINITLKGKDNNIQENGRDEVITALNKMSTNQTRHVYQNNILFIKTQSTIYQIQCEQQNIYNSSTIKILSALFDERQAAIYGKKQYIRKKQIKIIKQKQQQKNIKQIQTTNDIKQFCLNWNYTPEQSVSNFMTEIQGFLQKLANKHNLGPLASFQIKMEKTKQRLAEKHKDMQVIFENKSGVLAIVPQNQNQQLPEFIVSPLKQFMLHSLKNISKPDWQTPKTQFNIQTIFHTFYKKQSSTQQILKNIFSNYINILDTNKIKYCNISQNPYEQEFYVCYLSNPKQVQTQIEDDSQINIIKKIRKQAIFVLDQIVTDRPKTTVICLCNKTIISLKGFYKFGKQISKLNEIYRRIIVLRQNQLSVKILQDKKQIAIKIWSIIQSKYTLNTNYGFKVIRKIAKVPFISHSIFQTYINRMRLQLMSSAFSKLSLPKKRNIKLLKADNLCRILNKLFMKLEGVSDLFAIMRCLSKKQTKITALYKILDSTLLTQKQQIFRTLYHHSIKHKITHFPIFNKLIMKKLSESFDVIIKQSQEQHTQKQINLQTECTTISKMNKLSSLSQLLAQKYPSYTVYFQLQNHYEFMDEKKKFICKRDIKQLKIEDSQQLLFPCKRNRNDVKNIVWILPKGIKQISLTDKHYLQIVSKSMQEVYRKSKAQCFSFVLRISKLMKQKQECFKSNAFNHLLKNCNQSIKAEQYQYRKNYYEYNIELQNLKMIEHQIKKQNVQQKKQMDGLKKQIQMWNDRKIQSRKAIVILDLQAKKIEEEVINRRQIEINKQMKRMLMIWKKNSMHLKKNAIQRKISYQKRHFPVKTLTKLCQSAIKNLLKQAYSLIKLKAASQIAKINSLQSKILKQHKESKILNINQLENSNRLMTFQDDFEISQSNQNEQSGIFNKTGNKNSQISIIPVSFKYYDNPNSNLKENMQVSEEQMKKINNGAYKLNSKTLKFLKRMGKINNHTEK